MRFGELVARYLEVHQAAPATIEKLRWLLGKATAAFGEVRLVDLRAEEICAWRSVLPEAHRFEATQALRQVLNAAVAWQLIDVNPATRGVPNPLRRFPEKRPFESWDEIRALAEGLGSGHRPDGSVRRGHGGYVQPSSFRSSGATSIGSQASSTFGASSCAGTSNHQRRGGVCVRCRFSQSRSGQSMRCARRRVRCCSGAARWPHRSAQLPRPPLAGSAGRARHRPDPSAIRPAAHLCDVRARAGMSIFDLSRFMGASLAMIDKHYGHLARDGREYAVALLDAYERAAAAWMSGGRRNGDRKPAHRQRSRPR